MPSAQEYLHADEWWRDWDWEEGFPVKWQGDYPVILVPDELDGPPRPVYLFGEPKEGRVLDIRQLQEKGDSS